MGKPDPAYVAALTYERDNYERAGRTDRAKAVQAELDRVTGTKQKPRRTTRTAATKTIDDKVSDDGQ